ncbi:MAG: alpha/beta hydrolase [Pseudomonadales bacterium]|nr:alpha/beta hydrolase [Pseudomonadales bacterium]
MLEALSHYLSSNDAGAWRAKHAQFSLTVTIGEQAERVVFADGAIKVARGDEGTDMHFTFSRQNWDDFVRQEPPIGCQSLSAMLETNKLDISGDLIHFSRHIMLLEGAFQSLRNLPTAVAEPFVEEGIEDIIGRYLRINLNGVPHRIYFEEAGKGIPLLCLHTAGADGRQYREVLNNPEITARFRVIVFDLPWHGKSSPPAGFQTEVYQLTTDLYMDTVMAVKEALGLQNPAVMGCSIGGRAVLHLALRHGDQFCAAIGLQSAMNAESHYGEALADMTPLWRPDIHGGDTAGGFMEMLIAPHSPMEHKWETLWHYMQGGPGVFAGDLYYYLVDGDMRNGIAEQIDTSRCPLYLLTGEYDVSATPEMTKELAELVGAQHFEVMKGMGHFPMSENPNLFMSYLKPILSEIEAA